MMKVLITGGFGYLGLHLAKFLLEKGHSLRIFDKNSCDASDTLLKPFDVVIGDICNKKDVENACKNIDVVIHLAAVQQEICKQNPELANKINVEGTKILLQEAEKANVSKFIFFSTFHVYGKPSGDVDENTKTNPLSEYAVTKLKAENYCMSLRGNTKCIILRLSNVYGSPLCKNGWNLVFNNLCEQAFKNQEIILNSTGTQKRDFLGIEDLKQTIQLLLILPPEKITEKLFNLGSSFSISIKGLADLIAKIYYSLYDRKIKISYVDTPKKETVTEFIYKIDRLKNLGYTPISDIKKEIEKIFQRCESDKNN